MLKRIKHLRVKTYLQSNVTELSTLSQSIHFGHGRIQETFILKDQITVWNHVGKFRWFSWRQQKKNTFVPSNGITPQHAGLLLHSGQPAFNYATL